MTERSTRRATEQEVIDAAVALIYGPTRRSTWDDDVTAAANHDRLKEAVWAYTKLGLDATSRPSTHNNTTDTANEAAASMADHVGKLANECFHEIVATWTEGAVGMTVDAIEQRLNRSHQSVSARVNELRDKGWVVDSGIRRPTRSGRKAIVWRPTSAALEQRARR
jgi:hypothetical protein